MKTEDLFIPKTVMEKWQGIVDLIAEIIIVPAALIMKIEPPEIAVFVSSKSPKNPYKKGEKASLDTGLYCETVMATRDRLLVSNALKDEKWKKNPDIKLGMISYLGFPVTCPTGDIFGTICVLDKKENAYNDVYQKLMLQFRDVVESDIKYLFETGHQLEEERKSIEELDRSHRESLRLLEEAEKSRRTLLSILEDEKRTKETLYRTEEKYRDLFNEAPVMYIITKKVKKSPIIRDCNVRFLSKLRYDRDDVIGQPLGNFYSKESQVLLMEGGYERALKGEFEVEERELVTREGQIIPTLLRAKPEMDNAGNIIGTRAMYVDITEQKQAEMHLKARDEEITAIFESTTDGILVVDKKGKVVHSNSPFAEMWNIPEKLILKGSDEELLDFVIEQLVDPQSFLAKVQKLYKSSKVDYDTILFKDGRIFERYSRPWMLRDEIAGRVWIFQDITEQKQATDKLRMSEENLGNLFQLTSEAIIIQNKQRNIIDCNMTAERLFGYSKEELITHPEIELADHDKTDRKEAEMRIKRALDGEAQRFEWWGVKKDGTSFPEEVLLNKTIYNGEDVIFVTIHDITERKQVEETLRNIAEGVSGATGALFFESLVQHVTNTLGVRYAYVGELIEGKEEECINTIAVSDKGVIIDNIEYDLSGTPCENVAGKILRTYPKQAQKQFPEDNILLEMGVESYSGTPLFDSKHRPLGIMVIMDDKPMENLGLVESTLQVFAIRASAELERRQAEKEITVLADAIKSIAECVSVTDTENILLFVNEAFLKTYGYERDELVGKPINIVRSPNNPLEVTSGILPSTLEGGWHGELLNIRKDGSEFPIALSTSIIQDEKGQPVGLIGVSEDITERKLAEEKIRESEESYRGLYDNASDAIYIQDKEGRFLDVNEGAVDMYGYPKEFFIGKTPEPLAAPGKNDMKQIAQYIERAFKGEPQQFEFWAKRKNGEIFPKIVRLNKSRYFGQDVIIAFALDISEQKRAEEELRRSEERYRSILEKIEEGYYEVDLKGNFTFFNDSLCGMLNYSQDELMGMNNRQYMDSESAERVYKVFNKVFRTGKSSKTIDIKIKRKEGKINFSEISISLLKDRNSKPIGFRGIVRDITERKQAEEELKKNMEQLDRANRLMVGRELKMVELKREINTLLEKAGQPKKYSAPDEVE